MAHATLRIQSTRFALGLALRGFGILLTGRVSIRSTFLPRAVGALMALAGLCYEVNSLLVFLAPRLQGLLFPSILMPCLLGEGAFSLWLITKGLDLPEWEACLSPTP